MVDWVIVELRSTAQPGTILGSKAAVVTSSGQVIGAGGTPLRFALPNGNYHVAVRHRNHFGCMTALPVSFLDGTPVLVDLSSLGVEAHGVEARKTVNGKAALWAGNVDGNSILRYTGTANDRDPILAQIGGLVPTNTVTGYDRADTNLDGSIRYTGNANDRDIILFNVGGVVPTNTRNESLP